MMLDMCKPETSLSMQERVVVILLEVGGAMSRDSLLTLLSGCVRRSRFDEVLGQMRHQGLIDTAFSKGHKAIYFLTADGAAFGKKLVGIRSKVRHGRSTVSYALTVEALLMRIIEVWGFHNWQFSGENEAFDEIAFLREKQGVAQAEIKKSTPSPSALIWTPKGTTCFISVDCHQTARGIYDETRRYITSLFTRDGDIPRVLFVSQTPERARWMRAKAMSDHVVTIDYCSADQAVDVLEGNLALTH